MGKDLYGVLGVGKNASEKDIKNAYRKLSLQYHPDRQTGKSEKEKKEAEEKFKEIAEAYSILGDKEKKNTYDTFGTTDFQQQGGFGGFGADDIFEMFRRHNPFGDTTYGTRQSKGADKKININLSLEDVYNGGQKDVTYTVMRPCSECEGRGSKSGAQVTCSHCGGSGLLRQRQQFGPNSFMSSTTVCPHCGGSGYTIKDPCSHCGGTGLVEVKETVAIPIPTIDKMGYRYKIDGGGNSCRNNGGYNGDLYYTFQISETNDLFNFDETNPANIITTIDVDIFDCMIGCVKKVKGVGGLKTHEITIPAGTKNGSRFCIKNEGCRLSGIRRGDLIVVVNTIMPKTLTQEMIEKINELKKMVVDEEQRRYNTIS